MKPTDVLNQEHRTIESVLNCLEKLVESYRVSGQTEYWAAGKILYFLKFFADGFHHGKEEDQLFPALEARAFSQGAGPMAVMRQEHDLGRQLTVRMKEGLENQDDEGYGRFISAAQEYLPLLRTHIQKEDHCLFPMAAQVLSQTEQENLFQSFHEAGSMGGREYEKCVQIARHLCRYFEMDWTGPQAAKESCCCAPAESH